jgi:hypothetical protein
LLLSWFIFTLVGWVFNVGEYSLENRREAVCDPRAYIRMCNQYEFDATHPHRDYEWDLGSNADDSRVTLDESTYDNAVAHGASFSSSGSPFEEEKSGAAKPWFSFHATNGFFDRGNDVFRRKSAQMDSALLEGDAVRLRLLQAIRDAKHGSKVSLPDAPIIIVREGVMPANAIGNQAPVTWGLCIKQECAANNADLPYALYGGDVLWTRPALGEHQQHAVDALKNIDTLAFWLQEAHASGVYDDGMIRSQFEEAQSLLRKMNEGAPWDWPAAPDGDRHEEE